MKDVVKKVEKELPEFASEVKGLTTQQLEHRLADLAKAASENEEFMENDEGLDAARAQAREFAAPYLDFRKFNRLKTGYIISLLKDKGGV